MRFLIALIPLITLAVHVVATNPQAGQSIPLNNVPSYPQPARLSSPYSLSDADTLVNVDLEGQQRPSAQRVQQHPSAQRVQQHPSAQRPCDACLQKALHIAEDVVKAPGRLLIASAAELAELAERNPKITATIVTCFSLGSIIYAIYHHHHDKREECEGCHVRRTGLSLPTSCQPLDCEDVCSATVSHTEGSDIVSSGRHAKRDVARLNYRRRLELD
ncbi:hypothetical protein F5050DRAFT_1806757 [Lentinula boryana]|uniref:Uncharacterized protein n=1 Tax=Lentinula boryana TaxID=40481 RepID=A0ABQ8QG85_9AGAR|nr:hypothetical protein F5050DRAFT_1806757 [Lentinula boryana]